MEIFEEINNILGCTYYKNNDEIDWRYVSYNIRLNEDFIRKYSDKVNWSLISKYQILSEDFIREFKDEVNWRKIFIYQNLSEKFILKSINGELSHISNEFIKCSYRYQNYLRIL